MSYVADPPTVSRLERIGDLRRRRICRRHSSRHRDRGEVVSIRPDHRRGDGDGSNNDLSSRRAFWSDIPCRRDNRCGSRLPTCKLISLRRSPCNRDFRTGIDRVHSAILRYIAGSNLARRNTRTRHNRNSNRWISRILCHLGSKRSLERDIRKAARNGNVSIGRVCAIRHTHPLPCSIKRHDVILRKFRIKIYPRGIVIVASRSPCLSKRWIVEIANMGDRRCCRHILLISRLVRSHLDSTSSKCRRIALNDVQHTALNLCRAGILWRLRKRQRTRAILGEAADIR